MKKVTLITLIAVLSLFVAAGASVGYIAYSFLGSSPSNDSTEVIYEVKPGQSFNAVAKDLEEKGLLKNAFAFSMYARVLNERGNMKRGEYALRADMKPSEVLGVITSGKSVSKPFTVAEGLNIYEISDLYEKQGFGLKADFLTLVKDRTFAQQLLGEPVDSLEGYLFPETYMITKFDNTKDLIASMVRRFLAVYSDIGAAAALPGWSRNQIVTLASIVEKETGAKEDRPLVSSVFHNRLVKKMKLQTDPTILYGMADLSGVMPDNIRKDDILKPTRYNTYVINALPPGPISNPGRESLMATLKPASSKYLYFVSRNDGTTVFSDDLSKHNKAVQTFQVNSKAREGKSWRDLKTSNTVNKK
ncbi:endolytic transglycosylase MltG [Bdellovibrio sp. HCB337]|uniref:endolytic transglycosylase MltG n=1 Tax=Bdellovibrio sp. HCB337 TaxID=3394358 RepID=UPI0039A41500